jgi:hypothetical protein
MKVECRRHGRGLVMRRRHGWRGQPRSVVAYSVNEVCSAPFLVATGPVVIANPSTGPPLIFNT